MAYDGGTVGTPTYGAAKFSTGLTAVADTNYLTLPTGVAGWSAGTSWTVDLWMKISAPSAVKVALSFGLLNDNSAQYVMWFGINASNQFCASVGGSGAWSGGTIMSSGISIGDNAWHHCRAVMTSGSTLVLCVDGVAGNSFSGTWSAPTHPQGYIGRYLVDNYAWTGAIDEVALWNTALATTYTTPSAAYTGSESNLRALYHLESNVTDSAGAVGGGTVYSPMARLIAAMQG